MKTYIVEVNGDAMVVTPSYGQALFWKNQYITRDSKNVVVIKNEKGRVVS
jgi:hypothetical protein